MFDEHAGQDCAAVYCLSAVMLMNHGDPLSFALSPASGTFSPDNDALVVDGDNNTNNIYIVQVKCNENFQLRVCKNSQVIGCFEKKDVIFTFGCFG
ncbi:MULTISPECIES: hypothetical protein [unclassified Cedecea]|uniref:hypothetical protein n=1 Tax=unclassified Cedecea TaxID=2649846 RepID=UPI00301732AF